ncbi:hypothetical protein NQ317_015645 [Molorchus minor]|uniref:DH domain-containing protein n=1 Tax=Molorchus minor TaxID=1323400 RepID=A0ABQ9IZF8_9CUCU|nr:hypothetical protein NQ317_015645 [Molorchus minor]
MFLENNPAYYHTPADILPCDSTKLESYNSTFGRRSILECDINPYELMSSGDPSTKDSSITLVNGQRIRVRPSVIEQEEYEKVQVKRESTTKSPSNQNKSNIIIKSPVSSPSLNEKESDFSNRFKSILKKPTTTFSDTDSNGPERSPRPPSKEANNQNGDRILNCCDTESDPTQSSNPESTEEEIKEDEQEDNKPCSLRRSNSDRKSHGHKKVLFHDTMALRQRKKRKDSRSKFDEKDLERLDGITPRTRKISPVKPRPNSPPPPPPPNEISNSEQNDTQNILQNSPDNTDNSFSYINLSTVNSSVNEITDKSEDSVPFLHPHLLLLEKKSNNKPPHVNIINRSPQSLHKLKIESPTDLNKTVVQINGSPAVHKIQIKNDFSDHPNNFQKVSVLESPQRKTSILINGDDCYSTVNVNDNVPLYQSSVVVKDLAVDISPIQNNKKSSTVYITGTFISTDTDASHFQADSKSKLGKSELKTDEINSEINKDNNAGTKENTTFNSNHDKVTNTGKGNCSIENFDENNIPSSKLLKELLRDPVEAVRRNLVPHVCGKSDMPRRPRDRKLFINKVPSIDESHLESPLGNNAKITTSSPEDSFVKLRNYEQMGDDVSSENSSSTQYELMDPGSDCYTDHSNRSSVTEDELSNRTKFYELLADAAVVEVSENEDHHYESIKINSDPIYEEIEIPPPCQPIPHQLLDKEFTTRSIFEGASKYDILSYLVDAKERGIVQEDGYTYNNFSNDTNTTDEETKEAYNRVSQMSTVSDSSEDNSLIISGVLIDEKATFQKGAEVERNDSGVGSETSKSSLSKYRSKPEIAVTCEDCETTLESKVENEPLICRKCIKKRTERKEIITEIVETEEKYSRDLQIILEEFYQPMLVAGLLTPEQLSAIFLNVEELLENSQALAERLRDAVEIALEQGDDDLLTVNFGKLFLDAAPMLHAFETYCVRQGTASLLLASLEKEKELLRIFLRVSQMENTMLRRMNLNSFLMVPVQRVTKYPLLLARLYKVTPPHHDTREQLKEAQHKIELHLNHMNSQTKDVPSKLWRRIGSSSGRRSSTEMDLVNIKLRKIAVDVLEWNHEEAKFALEGKLLFTQPTDNNWRKGRTIKLAPVNALLVINGKPSTNNKSNELTFARHGVREAALLLVRDKNGRYSLLREPLYLDRCVIAADPAWQSYFEVQELLGKDTFIFKAEDDDQTHIWYSQLQYYAQGMGAWRKRRNALANIMINGMGLRT